MRLSKTADADLLLKAGEAAAIARVSYDYFMNHLIGKGIVPPEIVVRIGRRSVRIHREKFLAWLEAGGNRDRFAADAMKEKLDRQNRTADETEADCRGCEVRP